MTPEEQRIVNKLALWGTPGFSQFIEDLANHIGSHIDIRQQVEVQRKLYLAKLKELEFPSKFKQAKLNL